MRLKKFNKSMWTNELSTSFLTLSSLQKTSHTSAVIADLTNKLSLKDAQVSALTSQVLELQLKVSKLESSTKSDVYLENQVNVEMDPHLVEDHAESFRTCADSVSKAELANELPIDSSSLVDSAPIYGTHHQSLLKTYEEANSQLLEKLKLRESENQSLVTRFNQVYSRLLEVEEELKLSNEKLFEQQQQKQERINSKASSDHFSAFNTSSTIGVTARSLKNKTSYASLASAAPSATPSENSNFSKSQESTDDAKVFINKLFDAIPLINFDLPGSSTNETELLTKDSSMSLSSSASSNNTMDTSVTSMGLPRPSKENSSNRNSSDSLLPLNKSAIRTCLSDIHDSHKQQPVLNNLKLNLRNKSPSTRSIKSFTSNSRKKVHQLSLYLSPSKDNFHCPGSPSVISSPVSMRSSTIFSDDLEFDSCPITPQSPCFSTFGQELNEMTNTSSFNKFIHPSSPALTNSSTFSTISSINSTTSKKLNFAHEFVNEPLAKKSVQGKRLVERSFSPASMEVIEEN